MDLRKAYTFTGIPVEEITGSLAELLPPTAFKPIATKTYLTDINTGHMLERATEVFGPRGIGWGLSYEPDHMIIMDNDVKLNDEGGKKKARPTARLAYAKFWFMLYGADGEGFKAEIITSGASQNEIEFAEEGARTAAIGSALKSLLFQNEVYKNELKEAQAEQRKEEQAERAKQAPPAAQPAPKPVAQSAGSLPSIMFSHPMTKEAFVAAVAKALNKPEPDAVVMVKTALVTAGAKYDPEKPDQAVALIKKHFGLN